MDTHSPFNFLNVQKVFNNGSGSNGRGFFKQKSKQETDTNPDTEHPSLSEHSEFNILTCDIDSILENLEDPSLNCLNQPPDQHQGHDLSLDI